MDVVHLLGRSRAHLDLIEKLGRVAPTDAEILITGPTGVGKELYARYTHKLSKRANAQLVAINCGAIPPELFENELFGHNSGAYTSAHSTQDGLVAQAEKSTLFLDEVDALSLPGQVKLLRFIEQKEYRRLGETRIRKADVRFIAATNADLTARVSEGRFREDLYYRLCVFPVQVPRLQDRKEDIPLLLDDFASRYSKEYKLPKIVLSASAFQQLLEYAWPGNVRELENCIKYLTCLQLARPVDKFDLPMCERTKALNVLHAEFPLRSFTQIRNDIVSNFEKTFLCEALRRADGNIARAAQDCGEYRKKIERLMKKHGLTSRTDAAPVNQLPSQEELEEQTAIPVSLTVNNSRNRGTYGQ